MYSMLMVIEWGDMIQPLLETILNIVLPIALSAAALWIRQMIVKAKVEIEAANLAWLLILAEQFVVAAEQAGVTGMLEDLGSEKKAYVLGLLQQAAEERGVKVDVAILSAIVEAAVVEAFGLSEPASG